MQPAHNNNKSILLIYTGGTIGMVKDPGTGLLKPLDFDHLINQIPELNQFGFQIHTLTFNPVIDSSEVEPGIWIKLARTIYKHYDEFDGFVILHGTDTMAYTASALSFLLQNLAKPVILTGAQLPIGTLRTDGKENIISSIEIAAGHKDGKPIVPGVSIYFEYKLSVEYILIITRMLFRFHLRKTNLYFMKRWLLESLFLKYIPGFPKRLYRQFSVRRILKH